MALNPESHSEDYTSLRHKKVLVVEDTISNLALVEAVLSMEEMIVFKAETGEEAINILLQNEDIDLIVMDIRLPGRNGYEITREIRSMGYSIPIIANTAYAIPGELERAMDAGCDLFFSKPTKRIELLDGISSLLNK